MAARARTPTLTDLIRSGRLSAGTVLTHRGRSYNPDRNVTATVVPDGIKLRREVFTSPSAAAKVVTGKAVDGWSFWRLPDGRRLDVLRQA